MPKNIFNLEPSSGGFSAAAAVGFAADISEAVDGAVEAAGEDSNAEEPDDAEAIPRVQIKEEEQTEKMSVRNEVREQKMMGIFEVGNFRSRCCVQNAQDTGFRTLRSVDALVICWPRLRDLRE